MFAQLRTGIRLAINIRKTPAIHIRKALVLATYIRKALVLATYIRKSL